jgi:Type II secretion system (T2SS), protein M subtype b
MSLARRILSEKRGAIIPLVVALVVNLGVYGLVVYPLSLKSATAADRARAAEGARQAAERDKASADALVVGKERADAELATFYQKVLPSDVDAATRMTYARLPALARKANLKFTERRAEPDLQAQKDSQLGRVRTRMVLEGDYQGVRQFLYQLETTPEFIIVDDVTLAQGETGKPLSLTVEVSTYYRQGRSGD